MKTNAILNGKTKIAYSNALDEIKIIKKKRTEKNKRNHIEPRRNSRGKSTYNKMHREKTQK